MAVQAGYTLIELLIVMSLSTVVVGVPMAFVVISLTQQNVASSRTAASDQEEIGVARLTRDLRSVVQSTTTAFAWGSTSASVSLTIPVPGTGGSSTETVAWNCAFTSSGLGSCTRAVNGGSAVKLVSNVVGVSFSPVDSGGVALGGSSAPYSATNPAYVGITVKVLDVSQLDTSASHGVTGISNPITLQAGVDLRNNSL
ncbi:MAG: type II secretion system GspH family protein [Actinomycetota bacterium]|nr:type II secretion system GspH family protein [Actinomycetota bacterium]